MRRHWHTRTLRWITPMPPEPHTFTTEPQMAPKIMQLKNIYKKCCATSCLFVVLKLAKATFKIDGSYYSLTHFYSRKLHTRVLSCCLQDSSSDLVELLIVTMQQHYCAPNSILFTSSCTFAYDRQTLWYRRRNAMLSFKCLGNRSKWLRWHASRPAEQGLCGWVWVQNVIDN